VALHHEKNGNYKGFEILCHKSFSKLKLTNETILPQSELTSKPKPEEIKKLLFRKLNELII
jgi:hypothetical protein